MQSKSLSISAPLHEDSSLKCIRCRHNMGRVRRGFVFESVRMCVLNAGVPRFTVAENKALSGRSVSCWH